MWTLGLKGLITSRFHCIAIIMFKRPLQYLKKKQFFKETINTPAKKKFDLNTA